MRVVKRDGSVQPFDVHRIHKAVLLAFAACREIAPVSMAPIGERVTRRLVSELVSVDDVATATEEALLESGYLNVARAYMQYRMDRTAARTARDHAPDAGAIADYIFTAKYARWRAADRRRETWAEAVSRVCNMHRSRYPQLADSEIDEIEEGMMAKLILPSMRSMQFGGRAIELHHARMYNCSFTHIDRSAVFSEIMYLLLCGCGVGFSVQRQHVSRLAKLAPSSREVYHHIVDDSIEGWAEAVRVLTDEAWGRGRYVEFAYDRIRAEGTPLRTSGGVAPGHLALKRCLEGMRDRLRMAAGRRLRPIELHDVICTMAECVLSGGIRRSSLISLFSADDGEMMHAKAPGNFDPATGVNSQRMMANNSVALLRGDPLTAMRLRQVMELAQEGYGEPGFFLTDHLDWGTNPCGEIGLTPIAGGFGFCNLTEINVAACVDGAGKPDLEKFYLACKLAARLGTLQAGYTDFGKHLSAESRIGCERDALLGVSLTGIVDNWALVSDGNVLATGAKAVRLENSRMAGAIGIRVGARLTTVKPSGTSSLVLGAVGSGIHNHHARRYFRRVTANPNEAPAQLFRKMNPHMVEVKPNGDWCLVFPIQVGDGAITRKNSTALEFLERVAHVYRWWVVPGTWSIAEYDSFRSGGTDECTHNVSCTVTVRDGERAAVEDWVVDHREEIAALSFVPETLDKLYPYAPLEAVESAADEVRWNALIAGYRPVDYRLLAENVDATTPLATVACGGGVCEVV